MANLGASITVSILALGVIFLTLSILIGIIKALVTWMPYKEPAPKIRPQVPNRGGETEEHIAIIYTTMAHYLVKHPKDIQITNIYTL